MTWLLGKKEQPQKEIARISDLFVEERNTHPGNLVALAVQRNDPIENIKQLMDLQERWEANEARKAYAIAMNAFKANPPAIFKDKHVRYENRDGSVTEYDHPSLGHVVSAISEGLGKEGLSHRWDQEQLDGGQIRVTCIITHAMGHSVSNFLQSSADQSGGKNNIQAIGSAVKYLQRYTLLSAVGLAPLEVDDDGRGCDAQPEIERISEEQVNEIHARITDNGLGIDSFMRWLKKDLKCDSLADINVNALDSVNSRINIAIQAKGK